MKKKRFHSDLSLRRRQIMFNRCSYCGYRDYSLLIERSKKSVVFFNEKERKFLHDLLMSLSDLIQLEFNSNRIDSVLLDSLIHKLADLPF